MDKTISVHWHGIFQNGTNYMDGTPYSTQCPITPGDSFTYEFSAANQAGTYWYRADSWDQSNGGVVGPLIIYDPSDPQKSLYDIDDESTIVMLSDYYHTNPRDLATSYLSPASNGVEPVPDNGLIGGLNTFDSAGSRKVFNFARGKRYRLRVINAGAFAAFQFSIDNHMLTVIEADGVAIQPVTVQRLPINVGQRYSVIVHSNQPVGNYWMRAVMNTDCFFAKNSALDPVTKAIVHYAGAPDIGPRSSDWESVPWSGGCVDLALNLLKPLVEQNAPPADLRVILNMSFQKTPNGVRAYVNGTSWDSPTSPTLLQVLNGANGNELVPPKTVVVLDKIQTVEILPFARKPFICMGTYSTSSARERATIYQTNRP
ncbi:laccase, multicopper oxidase, benzenediol:oxygen oxidorectuctase [Mortierella alpina]|nr:laccase, multicopper oxidase, benzenediol:oxygen oxidorectuctase [Mortierella alpina]